jgi:two-component system sensor histidine kinase PilS (NtrC family)
MSGTCGFYARPPVFAQNSMKSIGNNQELRSRLKTIMAIRVALLTGFVVLLLVFGARLKFSSSIVPLTWVICSGYLLCITYALIFKAWNLFLQSCFQILGDLFLVAGIIYTTGGSQSPVSFLFLFVIVAASSIFSRTGCYLVAACASILYGSLIDLEYYEFIQPHYLFHKPGSLIGGGYAFYLIFLNIGSYYAVAYLSGLLNHRLRAIKKELDVASKNLLELQAFHANVVQDMGSGLITADASGRITSMNRSAEEITGFDLRESLGQPCDALLPIASLKNFFKQSDGISLPFQTEGEYERKDGKFISIRMKVSQFSGSKDDPQKGIICVFEDLTEFHELQDKISQAEKLAAVGRISAGLAHEIRNPLASVSGSIQMLSKGLELENYHRKLMEIVMKETDRLNSILTDFLNYSQPRKNRKTLVDLTQLILDVNMLIKNNEDFSATHKIDFHSDADHLVINADEEELKQLVWNLCINGLQSMDVGGTLKIGLKKVSSFRAVNFQSDKRGYLLTIEDQGCGISQAQLKKIFDPFNTTKENGVGLGLATVYRIVQQNEGAIEVTSKEGQGTTFSVYLPRGAASNEQEPALKPMIAHSKEKTFAAPLK